MGFSPSFFQTLTAVHPPEADPSKDSFLRLLSHVKVLLICFVIFTLSSGLGFFDATLSLFAMKTVGEDAPVASLWR